MHCIEHYLQKQNPSEKKINQSPCLVVNNKRGEDFIGVTISPSSIRIILKQREGLKTPHPCSTPDGILQPHFYIDNNKLGWRI